MDLSINELLLGTSTRVALSVLFSLLGVLIMWIVFAAAAKKVNLKKELLEDQNTALAVMFAGVFIAVAIIIAAAMK